MNASIDLLSPPIMIGVVVAAFLGLWIISVIERRKPGGTLEVLSTEEDEWEALDERIHKLRSDFPDLPPLPLRRVEYEGWFRDVMKRHAVRSEQRTLSAFTTLLADYLKFMETCMSLKRAKSEMHRTAHREKAADVAAESEAKLAEARAKVEESKLQAELIRLEVEKAKAEQELESLRNGCAQSDRHDPVNEFQRYLDKEFGKFTDVDSIRRRAEEEKKKYAHDPSILKQIDKAAHDMCMRILEGRK